MKNIVFNSDCLEAMKQYPNNHFDLACVDPPYGIGRSKGIGKRKNEVVYTEYKDKKWDKRPPPPRYFIELRRVSKNQIIWGANYYGYRFSKYIVWDKKIGDNDFSMAEIASHSFQSGTKIVSMFCGANRSGKNTTRIHPTQKPIALYDWIFKNYARPGDTILDTHVGSGSSRIAAHKAGLDFIGYEIDTEYWADQEKRYSQFKAQTNLFY